MQRHALIFLGLFLPLMAVIGLAQSAPDLLAQAEAKKHHGDFNGAIADYTQALAADPKNVNAYLGRASVYSLEGNYAGAIKDDTRALVLDPKNPVAYSNRGNARMMQGDLHAALADYTQAIKLDPHHVRAFINRGNIKNLQKNYGAALEDYSAAIALDPKSAVAFYNRAGAKRSLGDYEGARADYSQAIALNPVDVEAYIDLAVLEMARKNWDAATTDLKKCLDILPSERQAYPRTYLWVIGVKQGEADKATRDLTHAANADLKTFSGTWGWEIAKFLVGQVDERTFLSAAITSQAKENKGQKAKALYFAGLKRALAGDKAGAAQFFQQCLTMGNPMLHEYTLAREELRPAGGTTQ